MPIEAKILQRTHHPRTHKTITTFQLHFPRIILSEFNTHRQLSRNASSSRAIPIAKMIEQVQQDPFIPVYWGKNQPGMKAREELSPDAKVVCAMEWLKARDRAVESVQALATMGLHKQTVNRILEPWMWVNVICTATEWDNFYALRNHADAQPEFKVLTEKMLACEIAAQNDTFQFYSENHIPYIKEVEWDIHSVSTLKELSTARCCRVSYNNLDNTTPNYEKDLALHDSLLKDGHMSPFEHIAFAGDSDEPSGNFKGGWVQYRKQLMGEERTYDYVP